MRNPNNPNRSMSWLAIRQAFGNGDSAAGVKLLEELAARLNGARVKHRWPDEADGSFQALGVIHAEYRELEAAVEKEGPVRAHDEALDLAAVTLRFLNGEHEGAA